MAENKLAVIILAAGKGSRMKASLPKVLHDLAGAPMISWVIRAAESLKPDRIIGVIGPDMDDVAEGFKPYDTIIQKEQNGTGGAVKAALPLLKDFKGDVLILLGDTPLLPSSALKSLIKVRHKDLYTGLSVLTVNRHNPFGYGRILTNDSGAVEAVVEEKDATAQQKKIVLCNTGTFCVDGARLHEWCAKLDTKNVAGEYYLTDLPKIAGSENVTTAMAILDDENLAQGCNTQAELAQLQNTAQQHLRADAMAKGTVMQDPSSVYLSYDTKIGKNVVIEPHVWVGPNVVIGSNVRIRAFSYLEGAVIGKGAVIGPQARLRTGADIGPDARIGNFVEIKKSRIGKRSKIGHLAYVGDCVMGDDTNFSAGAITVNYDGFEKHQTTIGKGVMVGSNVNLVAPVHIDDGAYIAAGSTITEDIPANSLSVARERATIRDGWAERYRKKMKKLRESKQRNKQA